MTRVLSEKILTAKKVHRCSECLGAIAAGESYFQQVSVVEGDFGAYKAHLACKELACELNSDSYGDEWTFLYDFCLEDIERAKLRLANCKEKRK